MWIAVVSVPEALFPLKLRGYLQKEAQDIHAQAGSESVIVMYVYLPERLLFAVTEKKLEMLLDGLVNKHASIYRIELRVVAHELNDEQTQAVIAEAESDLAEMLIRTNQRLEQRNLTADMTSAALVSHEQWRADADGRPCAHQ